MPDPDGGLTASELRERYGDQVDRADEATVLRLLGRDDIDPDVAWGSRYATIEAFEAFSDGNRRHHGHETIGPVTGPDGHIYGLTILKMPDGHEEAVAALNELADAVG
jgi:hypothetical protein